jgi:serine/threonine protein kinase
MLNNMGDIVFIDFGTLRELKRVVASRGTAGIGKFGYTPPEQWQGKPVPQSDIFALGATIYYLLTGYLPLSKKYLAYGDPQPEDFKPLFPPIRERNAAISEELERTLSQALQLDVSKRYQSAAEMRQAVQTREPSLRKPSAIRTTPAMLTCCNHKCGKSNKAELIYCEYCEFPLHDGSKQCVKCRLSIPVKLLFCTNCGTRQP